MPLKLDKPKTLRGSITTVEISSFTIDTEREEIYIAYSLFNEKGRVITDKVITLSDNSYKETIESANDYLKEAADRDRDDDDEGRGRGRPASPAGRSGRVKRKKIDITRAIKHSLYEQLKAIEDYEGQVI